MSQSKVKNSVVNLFVGGGSQVIYLILSFIGRSIFVRILNADYLGVHGLFSNILTILSFSELGIGSALIYGMYKPIILGDNETVASYLQLYKKAYNWIAAIVLIAGGLVTPFLYFIIKDEVKIVEQLQYIYLLYLLHTVVSYVLSYRKSLFTIHQKDYIVTAVDRLVQVTVLVTQLILLYLTHNYYLYLSMLSIGTLVSNIYLHILAGKKYPEIVKSKARALRRNEKKGIVNDVSSIFCYKVGDISLNATDNLIINSIINVTTVGLCSNYVMLINGVSTVVQKAFYGIAASLGILNASEDNKKKESVLNELTTFTYWLIGFCCIELVLLLNNAVSVWLGDSYLFTDKITIIALVSSFYMYGTNLVASNFRTTMGYFNEAKFVPSIAAVINIILSIVLGKWIGLSGIYFATAITRMLTFSLFDPIIILRKGLKKKAYSYYFKLLAFTILTICNCFFCSIIVNSIHIAGWSGLLIKAIVVALISNFIYFVTLCRTQSYASLKNRLVKMLRNR